MNKLFQEIIRVDHAGEAGAVKIYEGQLSVMKNNKKLQKMLESEKKHLDFFEKEIVDRDVRPSFLMFLWNRGGYMLGKVTALMGEKAAMTCTEAVETVIEEHYKQQISCLDDADPLKTKLQEFREEEIEHQEEAINSGSKQAFAYPILFNAIKTVSKIAIKIAKKI